MSDSAFCTLDRVGDIAVLTLDNPPVNALSHPFRIEIARMLDAIAADKSFKGLIIACAGRTFISGADIKEFGQNNPPMLLDLIGQLENMPIPTVACIHGKALGGGFELSLAATFRVAEKGAQIGLPEVKLGLLPGAGGTVRTTYLAGALETLKLAGSGEPLPVEAASKIGLIDAVLEGDRIEGTVAFLNARIAEGKIPRRVRDRFSTMPPCDIAELESLAGDLCRKTRSQMPKTVMASIHDALTLRFDEAMREERRLFDAAVASPVSAAMRHVFFAERTASKPSGAAADARPRTVKKVGVIGAGTMGGGIAMAFANAGFEVLVRETNEDALKKGISRVESNYRRSAERGSISETEAKKRAGRIAGTISMDDLASCDLIVEAAFEDMAIKKEIFSELGRIARKGAILATNTSYLDVDEIARSSGRPADVVGLHFFSPANVMKLLEIVRGEQTPPDVIATALDAARRIGKQPVVVGVCHGFVGNRMLAKRNAQLSSLIIEGAAPDAVDKAFRDFGWPMGPCQMGDLAGLDIGWRTRQSRGLTDPLLDRLCELGRFGQKTGKGWYLYEDSSKPVIDDEVTALIEKTAADLGIKRHALSADEIIERTHGPMIEEGRAILAEGIAERSSDIDVVWIHGYGFPRSLGGPMYWDDHLRGKI